MKYILAAYLILNIGLGVQDNEPGRVVRFIYVAMPLVMVHAIDVPAGNSIVHWHL